MVKKTTMNQDEIIEKLREIKPHLAQKYNVAQMGLFGSYARGDFNERSDIDILVEYTKTISLFKIVEAMEFLQQLFNKKIDLANKKNLKTLMKTQILNEVIYV